MCIDNYYLCLCSIFIEHLILLSVVFEYVSSLKLLMDSLSYY